MEESSVVSSKLHRRLVPVGGGARAATVRLVWLVAITVATVAGTTFLNRAFERMQTSTAQTWYQRGVAALKEGKAAAAVTDLRAALGHDRDNQEYVLRLAQALAAAGETAQAKAYFLNLWQARPGDGELNLQLARLAVREHSPAEAEQYYHGAIFGVWDSDSPLASRQAARRELIEFLLSEKQYQHAQAELIAMSAETPASAKAREEIGRLFLRAGNAERALQSFELAVKLDPEDGAANAAAGQAAFELGDFKEAHGYLERAAKLAPEQEQSRELLAEVNRIEELNPFAPGLRYSERLARTMGAFATAGERLQWCAQSKNIDLSAAGNDALQADAAEWQKLKPAVTARGLRGNPDLADTAAHLALNIETHTAAACGTPTGDDLALLVIAQKGGRGRE